MSRFASLHGFYCDNERASTVVEPLLRGIGDVIGMDNFFALSSQRLTW
jgi:hypothetical protein